MKKYFKVINGQTIYSDGKILKTEDNNIINPTEEQMLSHGWQLYVEPEPSVEELLQESKIHKIIEVEEYDSSPNVNVFYLAGVPLWLDAQTRQQLRISINAYNALGMTQATKWFNGQSYTFPITLWITMLNSLEVYAAEALNVTEQHKANIMNLNTIEDIEEYDYTVGYPQKVQFNL